ncbi:FAD-dependent monooxygenase [Catenovulum sediminis]|uniref:FAD-dependent monooxygenase n=1 Tax=Catenovulum sediminis TaxID=1740262 RepID=A0ABV1RC15_9ALTE|nr:FAD-dependent monooxygenase [Catenovulum sediminis]
MSLERDFDIIIVGAGMVGASVASALQSLSFNCLLLDKQQPQRMKDRLEPQLRISSISKGSIDWLQSLGIWQKLNINRIRYYNQLSVAEKGGSNCTFDAQSLALQTLGCFVENNYLQTCAQDTFAGQLSFEQITSVQFYRDKWQLYTLDGHCYSSKLLIAADGANSQIRKALGLATYGWQYPQHCLSVNIKLQQDSGHHTWQKFDEAGAYAFLPLFAQYASLILYRPVNVINDFKNKTNKQQKALLAGIYGGDIADFEIVESASFPLKKMTAHTTSKKGAILIGDAAHTIHPLAGQGVNLGFRDAIQLVSQIKNAHSLDDLQHDTYWHAYNRKRALDVISMSGLMDLIYFAYQSQPPIIKLLRNTGVGMLNITPPLKNFILKNALGEIQID